MSSETIITEVNNEGKPKGEVSVSTVARMMGLATTSDLSVLEGKLELLLTRTTSLTLKVEKLQTALQNLSTGADIDRVEVQVGGLKAVMRELLLELRNHTGNQVTAALENTGERVEAIGTEDGEE